MTESKFATIFVLAILPLVCGMAKNPDLSNGQTYVKEGNELIGTKVR